MKKSSFDLSNQNLKLESRIVVALERISEAFRVLLWYESKEMALSPIQIQILIFLRFHSAEKCKISYLADEFNMTKATISDSVKVLLVKNLVSKCADSSDSRSFNLLLTASGQHAADVASLFTSGIEEPIGKLSNDQKESMLSGLLHVINDLNKSGIITLQRMCFSCYNCERSGNHHYCNLLKKHLSEKELRIDCPDHQAALG